MTRRRYRADRVGRTIQRSVAWILQNKIRGLRPFLVTVSSVEVSSDFRHARVFVTFLRSVRCADDGDAVALLRKHAGCVRRLLASSLSLRFVPRLVFASDDALRRGRRVVELLERR